MNLYFVFIQLIWAAFCLFAGLFIGQVYKWAADSSIHANDVGDRTLKNQTRGSSFLFDMACLGLCLAFAIFLSIDGKTVWLILALAIIYRLFYAMTVNAAEGHSWFYLDEGKKVDRWVRYALNIKKGRIGVGAGLVQFIVLIAGLILINLFLL